MISKLTKKEQAIFETLVGIAQNFIPLEGSTNLQLSLYILMMKIYQKYRINAEKIILNKFFLVFVTAPRRVKH